MIIRLNDWLLTAATAAGIPLGIVMLWWASLGNSLAMGVAGVLMVAACVAGLMLIYEQW